MFSCEKADDSSSGPFDSPQSPAAVVLVLFLQDSLSVEDGGPSKVLCTLEEADDRKTSRGGAPTSNVLVNGMTAPTPELKEPPMVTATV